MSRLFYITVLMACLQVNYTFAGVFIDGQLKDRSKLTREFRNSDTKTLQFVSHGKSGALLIEGKWLQGEDLAQFLGSVLKKMPEVNHINLYGCEFAKAEAGRKAVTALEQQLGVSVAASDDVTGMDGDWDLEVGPAKNVIHFENYNFNLQTCASGLVGGTGASDDFDGDGWCNSADVDDDNDGIPDFYEEEGTFTCTGNRYIQPDNWSSTVSGANVKPTSAELAAMTDVNSGTGYTNATASYSINQIFLTTKSTTVTEIRIYNYGLQANVQNNATPHLIRINGIYLRNAANQIVYTHGTVTEAEITSVVPDQTYYAITLPTPAEAVTSVEFNGLVGHGTAGFGLRDLFVVGCSYDVDNDGFPNKFDTDSDNDGCPDALESNASNTAGHYVYADLDTRWMVTGAVGTVTTGATPTAGVPRSDRNNPTNSSGGDAYNAATTSNECKACNPTSTLFSDIDGDGVADRCDLDNDNDGILDTVECPTASNFLGGDITYLNLTGAVPTNPALGANSPGYKKVDAGIAPNGKHVDVVITALDITQGRATPIYQWSQGLNGEMVHNGGTNGLHRFTAEFFETGTSTPIALNVIFTVRDIDGDGDWNSDHILDDPTANDFQGSKVGDDYFYFNSGYNAIITYNDPTLVYHKKMGYNDYFFSSGSDNPPVSAKKDGNGTPIVGNRDSQMAFISLKKITSFRINYFGGQYTGVFMNFTPNDVETCDLDGDGIANNLDLDSDGDGCPDAIEGGGKYNIENLETNSAWDGGSTNVKLNLGKIVDANGVPNTDNNTATNDAQSIGNSQNAEVNDCNSVSAENDINQTPINTPVSGSIVTNDKDPQGDVFTVTAAVVNGVPLVLDGTTVNTIPGVGTLVIGNNGAYTFTPATGWTGDVPPIHYTITDAKNAKDTAILTIKVMPNPNGTPQPPVANDDTNRAEQGQTITSKILSNDADPEGQTITVISATGLTSSGSAITLTSTPQNVYDANGVLAGKASINSNGEVIFTADLNYVGKVPIQYVIRDTENLTDNATLVITVEESLALDNDVYANDDANVGIKNVNQTGNILNNDSNPDAKGTPAVTGATSANGSVLQVNGTTLNTLPSGGTLVLNTDGSYTYRPAADFIGTEVVKYQICDNGSPQACDMATLYLTTLDNCLIEIGGTIYGDLNGLTNGIDGVVIDGTAQGLYISLVEGSTVLRTQAVSQIGKYKFTNVTSGTYSLVMHTLAAGSVTPGLPGGFSYVGEGGSINGSGLSSGDGTVNGQTKVNVSCAAIAYQNVRVEAVTSYLHIDFGIYSTALPVILTSFVGEYSAEGNRLHWKTTQEKNFDYYQIERSVDPKNGFQPIANVSGGQSVYTYLDQASPIGMSYYRLKMVDLDKSFAYSRMVSVAQKSGIENHISFPNPVDHHQFYIRNNFKIESYKLYDVNGREVNVQMSDQGANYMFRVADNIQQGIYVFVYFVNGQRMEKKLVIQ